MPYYRSVGPARHTHKHQLHPSTEYTIFKTAYGTLPRIDYMLGQKQVSLNQLKIKIISIIFSYHNSMKLEITEGKL